MKTKVIFKKFPEGDIIALFQELPGNNNPYATCLGYQHIGQHNSCDVGLSTLKPAKPNEYLPLLTELERIGYELVIVKKFSRKMLQARINDCL